jgi:hypothetical protein
MKEKIEIEKGRISEFSARGIWISPADLSTSISVWKRRFGPYVVYVRLLHLDPQRQWNFYNFISFTNFSTVIPVKWENLKFLTSKLASIQRNGQFINIEYVLLWQLQLVTKYLAGVTWKFLHGATTPSRPRPPHYQDFTITLRHTTLTR